MPTDQPKGRVGITNPIQAQMSHLWDHLHHLSLSTTIDFDKDPGGATIPSGAVINQMYPGVTFSCVSGTGQEVYAHSASDAATAPNVVSVPGACFGQWFDSRMGAVKAQFEHPVQSVKIDAKPVLLPEHVGPITNKPFLEAFDSTGKFLGEVLYPLNYGDPDYGNFRTLEFKSPTANIAYVLFSSQHHQDPPVYGEFDNLAYTAPLRRI
jgi:hypothetical protein